MHYLLKTEPSTYSFADLQREGETTWDGIKNPQALKLLAQMKPGDDLVLYHSGESKEAVGTAKVASVDAVDPRTPRVRIDAAKPLDHPKSLAAMRANPAFEGSLLLRQSRLSVVPLTREQFDWIVKA